MFVEDSNKFLKHSKLNNGLWATIGKPLHWWAALVDIGHAGTSPHTKAVYSSLRHHRGQPGSPDARPTQLGIGQ